MARSRERTAAPRGRSHPCALDERRPHVTQNMVATPPIWWLSFDANPSYNRPWSQSRLQLLIGIDLLRIPRNRLLGFSLLMTSRLSGVLLRLLSCAPGTLHVRRQTHHRRLRPAKANPSTCFFRT